MNDTLTRRANELADAERRLRGSNTHTPEWSAALLCAVRARAALWDAKNELWDWNHKPKTRPGIVPRLA